LKKYFSLILILFLLSCKSDVELAMERGIQYYEWGSIEKAILEFKNVIHTLTHQSKKINYNNIKLLSRAHHNLSVSYAKKSWYQDALKEAKKAFELLPSDNNKKVINLIQKKISNNKQNTPPIKEIIP
tara:strand:- start:136 stop:519 length:384 start_codon:yes stop_codon:yes gene_type:complete